MSNLPVERRGGVTRLRQQKMSGMTFHEKTVDGHEDREKTCEKSCSLHDR